MIEQKPPPPLSPWADPKNFPNRPQKRSRERTRVEAERSGRGNRRVAPESRGAGSLELFWSNVAGGISTARPVYFRAIQPVTTSRALHLSAIDLRKQDLSSWTHPEG